MINPFSKKRKNLEEIKSMINLMSEAIKTKRVGIRSDDFDAFCDLYGGDKTKDSVLYRGCTVYRVSE